MAASASPLNVVLKDRVNLYDKMDEKKKVFPLAKPAMSALLSEERGWESGVTYSLKSGEELLGPELGTIWHLSHIFHGRKYAEVY